MSLAACSVVSDPLKFEKLDQAEPVIPYNIVLRGDNIALVDGKDIKQISLLGIRFHPVQLSFNTIQAASENLLDDRIPNCSCSSPHPLPYNCHPDNSAGKTDSQRIFR